MLERLLPRDVRFLRCGVWSLCLAAISSHAGCAGPTVEAKLARVGLELVSEEEAGVPAVERGRYLPCQVIEGFPETALPPHPAGYLFVGVDRQPCAADEITQALREWAPGETRTFTVRRNPYLLPQTVWWEYDVHLHLPSGPE